MTTSEPWHLQYSAKEQRAEAEYARKTTREVVASCKEAESEVKLVETTTAQGKRG